MAIRSRGDSLAELFTNAAWGMMDLICDSATVRPDRVWPIKVSSPDPEVLMVDFLTELLVLFDIENALMSSVEVDVEDRGEEWVLTGRLVGEVFEPGRHELLHDIKAVTYHTLEVRPDEGYARVLFDI